MERPTREIATQAGTTLVVHEYVSGGDRRRINDILRQAIADGKDLDSRPAIEENKEAGIQAQPAYIGKDLVAVGKDIDDALIEVTVVSINGKSDNVLHDVLALEENDYAEVYALANEIVYRKKNLNPSSSNTASKE